MGKDLKGRNLGVGISQRPDGRYHARALINGRKVEVYNKSLSKLKKDFELAKANALKGKIENRTDLSFSEWFDKWFESYKSKRLKSEVSRNSYYSRVKNTYMKLLGDKNIGNITHMNIQDATNELAEKKYTPRTIRESLGAIRECFDIAVINGIIETNPVARINIRENTEAMYERRVLDNWEMPLFFEEIERDYYCEAYKILLLTGMRIGEFSALAWEDVDFNNKVVRINKSLSIGYVKGKKIETITTPKSSSAYREIPFFGETEQLFKSWKQKQNAYKEKLGNRWRARSELGNLVFTSSLGSPVTRYVLVHSIEKIERNMRLKEISRAAKEGREPREIKHIHPHAFRHTFATLCFQKGIDPVVVQSIMGHSDYATTLGYTHVLKDKRQQEAAKAGDFFS